MSVSTTPASLRRAILGNGLFSTIAGAATALWARQLARFMEIPSWILYVVGLGTLAFGVALIAASRAPQVSRKGAALTIFADVTWVVAALVVVAIPGSMTAGGKLVYGLVSVVVAVFAVLQIRGLIADTRQNPYEVESIRVLDAAADDAWNVLTDLPGYGRWNPFIIDGKGNLEPGQQLEVTIQLPGRKPQVFRPTVTHVEEGRSFGWLGSLGVPGVFDGRHRFEVESSNGETSLVQSEEFSGVLVPLLTGIFGPTEKGFAMMNEALDSHAARTRD